jgi:serine/threonine protein kinase
MAPEAITGTAPQPGNGKTWKLGRPADVWALGCILYQMVYGAAPFAHIENMISKIAAIPSENHKIDYPKESHGVQVRFPPHALCSSRVGFVTDRYFLFQTGSRGSYGGHEGMLTA